MYERIHHDERRESRSDDESSEARDCKNVGIPMFARVSNDMVSKATAALATVRAARAVVRE